MTTTADLDQARRLLAGAHRVCALTGAGISAASGLGLFRGGPGDDPTVDRPWLEWRHYRKDPAGCWPPLYDCLYRPLVAAEPSRAHRLLAGWGEQLSAVITQNVDGLHQAAGSPRLIELHGNLRSTFCWRCRLHAPYPRSEWSREVPRCGRCGKPVKPNIVLYGEKVRQAIFDAARWHCLEADVLLVIGTSCAVYPAAFLPEICRQGRGVVIEINPHPSELSRDLVDLSLPMEADAALVALLDVP